jgi:hypothetical protein
MTKPNFYKKLEPVYSKWIDGLDKDGAVARAFEIAYMKEVLWRMSLDDTDDANDDVPFLDDCDPEWFLSECLLSAREDEYAADIFLNNFGEGYEHFEGLLKMLARCWEMDHGGKDNVAN